MIPAKQREALTVLAEVVDMSPEIRLGQLFAHLGFLGEDQTGHSLSNIDDEDLLAVLCHHREELAARQGSAGNNARERRKWVDNTNLNELKQHSKRKPKKHTKHKN